MKNINLKQTFAGLFAVLAIIGAMTFNAAAQNVSSNEIGANRRVRCNENTLGGSYGTNISGTFLLPPAPGSTNPPTAIPIASVGRLVFDGVGNVWGKDTNSFGGDVTRYPVSGTYTVDRDCTGTLTLNLSNGFVINNDLVIVDGGKEVFMIETNPGTVVTGVMKRQ